MQIQVCAPTGISEKLAIPKLLLPTPASLQLRICTHLAFVTPLTPTHACVRHVHAYVHAGVALHVTLQPRMARS